MSSTFVSVRDLTRNTKKIFQDIDLNQYYVITNQGQPTCFLADYQDLDDFLRYKELKRLQDFEPEEVIDELQNMLVNLDKSTIPTLEEQLSDL